LNLAEPHEVHLKEGTYAQGGGQGSLFWTDWKRHTLCITPIYNSRHTQHFEFVIDYGSICTIVSENKLASHVPWDHKTTQLHEYARHPQALAFTGSQAFAIYKEPCQGVSIHSLNFTPDTYCSTKQTNTPSDNVPWYTIHCTILLNILLGGFVEWVPSEDNILAFVVSWWVSFRHSYSSVACCSGHPQMSP